MFGRALRRRCPLYAAGPITVRWFHLVPVCPGCGLRPDRGETDYFLGAIVFNMAFAEGLFALGILAVLIATWPHPPWDALYYGGIAAMIVAPIALYPYSRLCWLAFDLLFRPPRPADFAPALDRAPWEAARHAHGRRALPPRDLGRRSARHASCPRRQRAIPEKNTRGNPIDDFVSYQG